MRKVCLYHSVDLDGWMSAAIVKYWNQLENKKLGKSKMFQDDNLDFIGYKYGDRIPDLDDYDVVIMCDISFPKDEMLNLWATKGLNFQWIDHHISAIELMEDAHENISSGVYPIQGLRDIRFAACELTWKYFFSDEPMPEIVRLLGRYDCFGHKWLQSDQDRLDTLLDVRDNSASKQLHPYIEELGKLLKKKDEEQYVLEFQYGARSCINSYQKAYLNLLQEFRGEDMYISNIHGLGVAIYSYLYTEAESIYNNKFDLRIGKFKFACINRERFNPINFGIDYHKDGYDGVATFYYANGVWNFSLYNDNGLVDCSLLAKQFGGGGHKGASGFIIKDSVTFNLIINSFNKSDFLEEVYEDCLCDERLDFEGMSLTDDEVIHLNFLRIAGHNEKVYSEELERLREKYK